MATINHRKLSRPVTVDVLYRCSPFEGIRIPWILNRFLSVEYTTEKLYKILIEMPTYQCESSYQHINIL
jgi:hypothetical protein